LNQKFSRQTFNNLSVCLHINQVIIFRPKRVLII